MKMRIFGRWYICCLAGVAGIISSGLPAGAGEWKSKGEVSGESRVFTGDDDAGTVDRGLGVFARLDAGYDREGPRFRVRGFGRVDHEDDSRDLTAFEEAWFGYIRKGWDVRFGFQMLNWSATEAFHPADIMNSRNLESNIENPEKLGELMLSLKRRIHHGGLTLYLLPRFEEPNLPEASSRLSFLPAGFRVGEPLWLEDDGKIASDSYGRQWGVRFTQVAGDADFSIHYLDHLDRQQPRFAVAPGSGLIRPVYSRVRDLGATYLHILGAWIFKLELSHKDFQEQSGTLARFNQLDHGQAALGLEYGWINDNGSGSTVLLEGQGLFGVEREQRADLSPFQRDLLVGYRHAWNDPMSRELLATLIFDVERDHEYLINLSYKQRLSDTWGLHTGLRWIDADPGNEPPRGLQNLDEANQAFVTLTRYF